MAQDKERDQQERLILSILTYIDKYFSFETYIDKYYAIPACALCILCVVGMAIIGGVMFRTDEWSYGIIMLLMLALALMTMAIISIVAMYREVSRLHARKFPDDLLEKMKLLKSIVEEIQRPQPNKATNEAELHE
jgi:predicted membrane protein